MHHKEQVGRIKKMVPLMLMMCGTIKRGKKLTRNVCCYAQQQHSNGLAHSNQNVKTSAEADDCKQAWQEHIGRCNEYRKMVAKRDNQLEREGNGGTKERTAGVKHTWMPGVVQAKGAIGNPIC